MVWDDLVDDLVDSFSTEEMNSIIIEKELNRILPGEYKELFSPSSAMRYVLVYSRSDYPFRSNELNWLKYAPQVYSYKLNEEITAFFVDISSDEEDYYIPCAAIIKIFNRVFDGNNVFLFRYAGSFSIGSARELSNSIPNNFTITGPINTETVDEYDGFFDELLSSEFSDLPQLIMQYSPQERTPIRDYDEQTNYDYDYWSAIEEFSRNYGVTIDTQKYIEDDEQTPISPLDTYKDACKALSSVVDNVDPSSYDELELVLPEANLDELDGIPDGFEEDQEIENDEYYDFNDTIAEYSEEAFKSADIMLDEMSRKNKSGGAK